MKLVWQSKLVLLIVLPFAGAGVVLQTHWWATQWAPVAIWTVGLSLLLALVVLKLRAVTPGAAFTGAVITVSLMFSTAVYPYRPWQTALVPVLAVAVLAYSSTRQAGRRKSGWAQQRNGKAGPPRRWRPIWAWPRWPQVRWCSPG
jgi:hypothetical protein